LRERRACSSSKLVYAACKSNDTIRQDLHKSKMFIRGAAREPSMPEAKPAHSRVMSELTAVLIACCLAMLAVGDKRLCRR
jgi:hypothetical protein